MAEISNVVGKQAPNNKDDVVKVQRLINDNLKYLTSLKPLKVDGIAGPKTTAAIEEFQKRVVNLPKPDARISPAGPTMRALLRSGCDKPEENFPYDVETFRMIQKLAPTILRYSRRSGVPPVAVAGSIADEYNVQRKWYRRPIDWFQDEVLINALPNFAIEIHAKIDAPTKALNSTRHDLGVGNIQLGTAKQMYNRYQATFKRKSMDYSDLVDYLRSDKGTVHVASLVIKRARQELDPYTQDISEQKAEGVYVTYYKQGPSYVQRFRNNISANPLKRIEPGEGCRVILQRKELKSALGLE